MERTRNDKREYFSSKLLQNAKPLKCVNVGLLFWTKIFHWILNKCHAKRHTKKLFSIDSWFSVLIRNFDSKGGKNAQNGQKMWIDSDVHIEINTPIHMPQSPLAYNSISCLWVFWTKFIRYAYTIYICTDIWSPLESNAYCPTSRICFKLKVSDIIIAVSGKIPKHMYCSAHKWYAFLFLWLQSQSVSIWI